MSDKLFKAARATKPDTSRVEYGFETRLLARLRTERSQPVAWFAWTWKLMPVFAAVVLALGIWGWPLSPSISLEFALGGTGSTIILGE